MPQCLFLSLPAKLAKTSNMRLSPALNGRPLTNAVVLPRTSLRRMQRGMSGRLLRARNHLLQKLRHVSRRRLFVKLAGGETVSHHQKYFSLFITLIGHACKRSTALLILARKEPAENYGIVRRCVSSQA